MDPNSLSKKIKVFLELLGEKDMMAPSWALGGHDRVGPPGSASVYIIPFSAPTPFIVLHFLLSAVTSRIFRQSVTVSFPLNAVRFKYFH